MDTTVKQLLRSLADIGLIKITEDLAKLDFAKNLNILISKSENTPSLEDITKEVESVKKSRYEKS